MSLSQPAPASLCAPLMLSILRRATPEIVFKLLLKDRSSSTGTWSLLRAPAFTAAWPNRRSRERSPANRSCSWSLRIVVNGQTVPLVTGDYELKGKSRGASTAKRTIGGAAVGTIIGAIAGGGKGAGIGAAVGGGAGAESEIITKGDQVKVPSETLLDFTLQQDVTIPKLRG